MQLQNVSNYFPYSYLISKETKQLKTLSPAQQNRYSEKLPTKSFLDVLSVSTDASNPYGSDLPVADFSGRVEFESTGDSERDENIRCAIDYYNSCFDFTNSRDYDRLTAEEDFTGMSNAEKYKAVYEKYQHCYGENFLEASAGDYDLIPSEYDFCTPIIRKFESEVNKVCGGEAKAQKARRDALYGENMSDTEVRQAIIDKYVVDGKITNRDYNKMTNEMDLCGVGGGIRNSNTQFGKIPTNIFDYLREHGMGHVADEIMKSYMTDREIEAYFSGYAQRAKHIEPAYSDEYMDSYMTENDFNDLMTGYEHRVYMNNVTPQYGEALTQILGALYSSGT